jgi:heme/copper-type cytochrome/quinol oxidase subunit 4
MIVTAVLCSFVPTRLFSQESIAGISVFSFLDWFFITVPNTDWISDKVYGISLETYRFVLAAFWCFLLILIFLWQSRRMSGKKNTLSVLCTILMIGILFLGIRFHLRTNDSIVRKDYSPFGTLRSEEIYRANVKEGEEKAANFSVSAMELELIVKSNLSGNAVLDITNPNLKQYLFTLYHGYQVKNVTDGEGNKLFYIRNGDFLDIDTPTGASQLIISYEGQGWKYFSNYQGIALPGYFAYYPVAGHLSLWDSKNCSTRVNHYENMYFHVTVKSSLNVFCNLDTVGPNEIDLLRFFAKMCNFTPFCVIIKKKTKGVLWLTKNQRQ